MARVSDQRVAAGNPTAWAALVVILLAHLLLAALLFDPKPFVGGDNAGYLVLAESLGSGQGYRDLYSPDAPRHTRYPPLYPAVLAAIKSFGGELIAFKTASVLFSTGALLLFYLLAHRRMGTLAALGITAALALNPTLLYFSHWVLPETFFLVLMLAAFWAAEGMNTSRWRMGLSLAAATLAYLSQTLGVFLILGLGLAFAWRRLWRQFGLVAAVFGIVVGGWWLWRAGAGQAEQHLVEALRLDPALPILGHVGPGELLVRIIDNARLYTVDLFPQTLVGPTLAGILLLMATLGALTIIGLSLVTWVRELRGVRPLAVFFALYIGYVSVLPQDWADRRYLLPLLPLLFLFAAQGLTWCFDFVRVRRRTWAVPAFAALLVLIAVPGLVRAVTFNQECSRIYRQGDPLACYPPPWRAFVQTALWVRENSPVEAVVVSPEPRLFYLFSARRGYGYPRLSEEAEVLAYLDAVRADYIVIAGTSAAAYRNIVPALRSAPERFSVFYSVGQGQAAAHVIKHDRQSNATGDGR